MLRLAGLLGDDGDFPMSVFDAGYDPIALGRVGSVRRGIERVTAREAAVCVDVAQPTD